MINRYTKHCKKKEDDLKSNKYISTKNKFFFKLKQQNYSNYHLWTRSIFSPESVQVIYHSNRCTYSKEFNMKMSNIESQIQIRKVWQSGFHVMLVIKHLWILKKKLVSFLEKMISLRLLHTSASIIDH